MDVIVGAPSVLWSEEPYVGVEQSNGSEELESLVTQVSVDVVVFAIDWFVIVIVVVVVVVVVVGVVGIIEATVAFAGGNLGNEKWKLPRIE